MQLDKNLRQGHRLTLSQHFFPSCLHLLDAGSVGRSAYPSNIPAAIKLLSKILIVGKRNIHRTKTVGST